MSPEISHPGVYVSETSSVGPTITGVPTSITAFVGRALRGPTDRPVLVRTFAEFSQVYGGLATDCPLGHAVSHFFLNGGRDALVCRVHNGGVRATVDLPDGFALEAADEGAWGSRLRVRVEHAAEDPGDDPDTRFDLHVEETATGSVESFLRLSTSPGHARFVTGVLAADSALVRTRGAVPATRPAAGSTAFGSDGADGHPITDRQIADPALEAQQRGLWLLDRADTVNLICIPPLTRTTDVARSTWDTALAYAERRRAVVLVDPPSGWSVHDADELSSYVTRTSNGAIYHPRVRCPDPLDENRSATFAPCGAVAGVIARTDAARGVWKAAAGTDAALLGLDGLAQPLTDAETEVLNPLGVNCLREIPGSGPVVWGARTLVGSDHLGSEWKYLPVRRTALFLEESIGRGTQWTVFEPNGESLWARLRFQVEGFLAGLFRQGAFQGTKPSEAYFARCDRQTMTQADIDQGIVTIVVGFAPLKPAEFVVLSVQQRAGRTT